MNYAVFVIGQEIWVRGPGVPGGCIRSPARVPVANPREAIDHSPDAKITVARGGQESVEGTATFDYFDFDAQIAINPPC